MRPSAVRTAMCAALPRAVLFRHLADGLHDAMNLMVDDPVAQTDVVTMLVAVNQGTTNTFPLFHMKVWHDLVAVRILQQVNPVQPTHPVFHGWLSLGHENGARRRPVLQLLVWLANKEVAVAGSKALYEYVLYNVTNKHLPNAAAHMLWTDVAKPDAANAQGDNYYAFKRAHAVSADGLPHDGRPKRRALLQQRLCLTVVADRLLDAYTRSSRAWGMAVRTAFADALRAMIVDDTFDWTSALPADQPSGPCAWRLLLPRRRQRVALDVRVQTMSHASMAERLQL